MSTKEYALYSPSNQGYWSSDHKWEKWAWDAKGFPTVADANDYIRDMGWINSTHADVRTSVYVVTLYS